MKYSVIQTGGKQYRVSEGDIIQIDKLPGKEGEEVVFPSVLLYVTDGTVMLGNPYVKNLRRNDIEKSLSGLLLSKLPHL